MWSDSSVWKSKYSYMLTACWAAACLRTRAARENIFGHSSSWPTSSLGWYPNNGIAYVQRTVKTQGSRYANASIWTVTQYMKIYGSIHIHCCCELTAYLNNLHFMQVWKYHLWADLLLPRGLEEAYHSSGRLNIQRGNHRIIYLVNMQFDGKIWHQRWCWGNV